MKLKVNKIIYPPLSKDISFDSGEGILTAITGDNSSAGSYLLSLIAGLTKPISGTITAGGKNIYDSPYNIGYIYTPSHLIKICDKSLYPPDSSYNCNYVVINHKLDTYGYISYTSPDTSDKSSIQFVIDSMLSFPDIILIDEPFAGKDDSYIDEYMFSLRNLVHNNRKICIIMSSHHNAINIYSNKIIDLNKYVK